MPNKLNDIFSESTEVAVGKITFADKDTARAFNDALEKVYKEGKTQTIPEFKSFELRYVDGTSRYPIGSEGASGTITIGPNVREIPIEIMTRTGEKTIRLKQYETDTTVVTFNDKNQPFHFELSAMKDGEKGQFSFSSNIKNANSIEELYESFEDGYGVFNTVFQTDTDDEDVERTRKYLINSLRYYDRIINLKLLLNLKITSDALLSEKNEELLCEQLFFMLCENRIIRSNKRLNYITDANLSDSKLNELLPRGCALVASFIQKWDCELFNNTFSIYTVNYVFNAVVDKSEKTDEGHLQVYFMDASPEKMYISTTGFLTEEQANKEVSHLAEKAEQYKNAKTIREILNEEQCL